jgi:nucleotide-binding universal stress UspA family protein
VSYASLMVHQDIDGANDCRLQIAAELARRFDARLIGIAAADPNPPAYGGGGFAAGLIKQRRAQIETGLKQAAERFHAAATGNAKEAEWRQAFAKPTAYVAAEARAADLVITGPARGSVYLDPFDVLDPAELVMRAGRPILVVPAEAETLNSKHVLVAWKDTREARRAVADALPLLQAAADVTVVEISEGDERASAGRHVADVAAWLKRHGVSASAHAVTAGEPPFAALQRLLSQNAADLIVAGAYGHSRLQEWILGGLTRDLLTNARCCCLLAH